MSKDPRRGDLEALLESLREGRNNWPRVTLQPNPRPSRKSFLVFGLAMALVATGLVGLAIKLIGGS